MPADGSGDRGLNNGDRVRGDNLKKGRASGGGKTAVLMTFVFGVLLVLYYSYLRGHSSSILSSSTAALRGRNVRDFTSLRRVPKSTKASSPLFYDYTTHPTVFPDSYPPLPPSGFSPDLIREHRNKYYPHLRSLKEIYETWPQEQIIRHPSKQDPFVEHLRVFDFQDPEERALAEVYRERELPFKVKNVPEIMKAGELWSNPTEIADGCHGLGSHTGEPPMTWGIERTRTGFFTWHDPRVVHNYKRKYPKYIRPSESLPKMLMSVAGFLSWAINGDETGELGPEDEHFYLQTASPPGDTENFVSQALPSFSANLDKPNFFVFEPEKNKGVQCRFGSRHTTAASHYDRGRNMVAMIVGAKRYVLAPPTECPGMEVMTDRKHPSSRHSLKNFAKGLGKSATIEAVETILKAGEVLYIPSLWFHYITSLQFSAQCNSRSGRLPTDEEDNWDSSEWPADRDGGRASVTLFGGKAEIEMCGAA